MSSNRIFKHTLAAALSLLTLTALCKPANAMETKKMLAVGGALLSCATFITVGGLLINHSCNNKEFKQTSIQEVDTESMSDEEVKLYLNEQITKFEAIGDKKTFVIDKEVKEKSNPRILALVIKGFNEIFTQYPRLAEHLVEVNTKTRCNIIKNPLNPQGQFRIQFLDKSTQNYNQIVAMCLMADGVAFNENLISGKLQSVLDLAREQVQKGAHSELNPKTLIEAAVAHEVGHIIDFLICNGDSPKKIIVELAKNKSPNLTNTEISEISKINESEWFAEVFALLMYGKEQNELSCAMRDYLPKILK